MDFLAVELATRHDWKIGFFSPENYPIYSHYHRLIEIKAGKPMLKGSKFDVMNGHERKMAYDFLRDHIYHVEPDETDYSLESILEAVSFLVKKYGINMFILDPWNNLKHGYDTQRETDYIQEKIQQVRKFARNHEVHFVVVAHPTKMPMDPKTHKTIVPDLYSISGSATWANAADNGIVVYRNFENKEKPTSSDNEDNTIVYIKKIKYRWIGRVGSVKFYFDPANNRYVTSLLDKTYTDNQPSPPPNFKPIQALIDIEPANKLIDYDNYTDPDEDHERCPF
jgi:twinkle protein